MKAVKSSKKQRAEVFDEKGQIITPTPSKKIDLHDAHAIRREMGQVYRDMRNGRIETQEGTRLVYVLDMLRKANDSAVLQNQAQAAAVDMPTVIELVAPVDFKRLTDEELHIIAAGGVVAS